MNKFLLKLTTLLLVLAGVASTCNPDPEKEYPKKISFTEYSLPESYRWVNLPYDEKVLIINSAQELEKYISCTEGSYPTIDFSRNTLLLASGYVSGSVSNMNIKDLKQVSANRLILSIDMDLQYKDCSEFWHGAIIVEKLSHDNHIKLNITSSEPKVFRPVAITDKNMLDFFQWALSDNEKSCFFWGINNNKDRCLIINSAYEFQQFYECMDKLPPEIIFPEIDFEKFTLIIGKRNTTARVWFADQKVIETIDRLTIFVQLYLWVGNIWDMQKYHWGIYPKLPNKPLFTEYKFEDE